MTSELPWNPAFMALSRTDKVRNVSLLRTYNADTTATFSALSAVLGAMFLLLIRNRNFQASKPHRNRRNCLLRFLHAVGVSLLNLPDARYKLALPREGHLEQVYHIFAYLKHASRRRIYLDPSYPSISEDRFQEYDWTDFYKYAEDPIPANMPTPRGQPMSSHCFVDSDHAGDKVTRRSQTGILIFCNTAPIISYSKRQNSVENVSRPESVLSKKQHSISFHAARESVAAKVV
jgi:hypothetical protein